MVTNLSSISDTEFALIADEINRHNGLKDVIAWAASKPKAHVHPHIVAAVITQDEYTHDVIVPYGGIFLVYDTT